MPGIHRETLETLPAAIERDLEAGLNRILLFGIPERKDGKASGATARDSLVARAVAALKKRFGSDVYVATDVCLCAHFDHGHCGVLDGEEVANDASLPLLAEMALSHAAAGADVVAPSDMMDGRVAAIRTRLDEEGLTDTAILSYAVKYASAYYGPFRDAADSAPARGDRRSYQMDPRNVREAIREVELDEAEGADMVMVKPALAYLDVIARVRDATVLPVAAYNVSLEYTMVKLAARAGLADERALVLENLTAIARAGADVLITYHAREAVRQRWL
jgi:porphobilinogen synthase